jgi:hypothetical protein
MSSSQGERSHRWAFAASSPHGIIAAVDKATEQPSVAQALETWRAAERATARSTALREAAEEAAASAQLAEQAARLTSEAANAAASAAAEASRAASATATAAQKVMRATRTEVGIRREDEQDAIAAEQSAHDAHDAARERAAERHRSSEGI